MQYSPPNPEQPAGAAGTLLTDDCRQHPRVPFIASVEVTDLDLGTRWEARISETNTEGCYIDTINPFPVGTRIQLVISHNDVKFAATGSVTHEDLNMGMDVAFTSVEPKQLEILRTWLAMMEAA